MVEIERRRWGVVMGKVCFLYKDKCFIPELSHSMQWVDGAARVFYCHVYQNGTIKFLLVAAVTCIMATSG